MSYSGSSVASAPRGRVPTGCGRLDEALQGGFLAGSAILLSAPASSEVPILVRNFLKASNEVALLICRSQSSAEAVSRPDDTNLKCLISSEKPISPSRNFLPGKGIDNLTELNFQITETIGSVQPKRVVIEILSDILLRHKALQTRKWLNEFLEKLHSKGITTVAILNPYMHAGEEVQAVVDLFDGNLEIIERTDDGVKKFLRVKWMHGVEVNEKEFPLINLAPETQTRGQQGAIGTVGEADLDKRRIAILPLANISPDPNDEYFADGMTEELISTTSSITGLTVIARTSVMRFKGLTEGVEEIGRKLRVGTVLEGSVRKAGTRLRITVQLIDVQSQGHLWAQSYDRDFDDVFAVQSDIAKQVADALRVQFLPNEVQQLKKTQPKSTEAYTLYLKGRFHARAVTKASYLKAIDYLRQATEKEPKYALAYAEMSECYVWLGSLEMIPSREAYAKAEDSARKALELDDSLPDAHLSLGLALASKLDFPGAQAGLERALDLGLKAADAHLGAAKILFTMSRNDDAITEARRALELDPLSAEICQVAGTIILYSRREDLYDEAIGLLRNAIELDPNLSLAHDNLGIALVQKGMYDEGIAEIRKSIEISAEEGPIAMGELAYAYTKAGKAEEAKKILAELLARWEDHHGSAIGIAIAYSSLGDTEKALEWLERAYEGHSGYLPFAGSDFVFDNIRSDSRFQNLLKKIGVATQT